MFSRLIVKCFGRLFHIRIIFCFFVVVLCVLFLEGSFVGEYCEYDSVKQIRRGSFTFAAHTCYENNELIRERERERERECMSVNE